MLNGDWAGEAGGQLFLEVGVSCYSREDDFIAESVQNEDVSMYEL